MTQASVTHADPFVEGPSDEQPYHTVQTRAIYLGDEGWFGASRTLVDGGAQDEPFELIGSEPWGFPTQTACYAALIQWLGDLDVNGYPAELR